MLVAHAVVKICVIHREPFGSQKAVGTHPLTSAFEIRGYGSVNGGKTAISCPTWADIRMSARANLSAPYPAVLGQEPSVARD